MDGLQLSRLALYHYILIFTLFTYLNINLRIYREKSIFDFVLRSFLFLNIIFVL